MLAPLLFVWPLSIAVTHYFASSVATYPYDQALRENVNAIARQVKFANGKPLITLPASARAMLRAACAVEAPSTVRAASKSCPAPSARP